MKKARKRPAVRVVAETYRAKGGTQKRKTLTGAKVSARKRMQTGTQTKGGRADDRQQKARYPGRRVSASGTKYTENRRNRSDASKVKKQ